MTADVTTPTAAGRGRRGRRPAMGVLERIGAVAGYFLVVYRRTWTGSVISWFLTPLLFLLAMGVGLGSLVDSHAGGVGGMSYLHFVVPGIVINQAMFVAVSEATYPVRGLIEWNKMYDSMLATPLGVRDVLRGHFLVLAVQAVLASMVFTAIAALFGGFTSWGALWGIPIALLTAMAFAVPLFAFTATVRGDGPFNIIYRLVITPLMLFSGIFFPIDQLPAWMQPIAWVTPLWHGVELARGAVTGGLTAGSTLLHLAVLAGFIGVGWVLVVRAFTRRLVP